MKNNKITIELLNTFITDINEMVCDENEGNYEIRVDIATGFQRMNLTDGIETFTIIWDGDENMIGKQLYTIRKKSLETIYELDSETHDEIADYLNYKFRMLDGKENFITTGDDLSFTEKRNERRYSKIQKSLIDAINRQSAFIWDIINVELEIEPEEMGSDSFGVSFTCFNRDNEINYINFTYITEIDCEKFINEVIEAFYNVFEYKIENVKIIA